MQAYIPPYKRVQEANKPTFNSQEQNVLKAQKAPDINPELLYGPFLREFICPNNLPVCTRCAETTHTHAICIHFRTKICEKCTKGQCEFDPCWFAKDEQSVRHPKEQLCIRVRIETFDDDKNNKWKRVKVHGCGQNTHCFRDCPIRQKLEEVIYRTHSALPDKMKRESATTCKQITMDMRELFYPVCKEPFLMKSFIST
jgi:hypothetical protein